MSDPFHSSCNLDRVATFWVIEWRRLFSSLKARLLSPIINLSALKTRLVLAGGAVRTSTNVVRLAN